MAKVKKQMTTREKRWAKVYAEFDDTLRDPDNIGTSYMAKVEAVARHLKMPRMTVYCILKRRKEATDGGGTQAACG